MDAHKHDLTDTYVDENTLPQIEAEFGAEADEGQAAEEAAVNIDTDIAREATGETGITDAEVVEEAKVAKLDQEMIADEAASKHKNRESTSEKAKRSSRQSTAEKAKLSEEAKAKALDPLRLRGKKYRAVVAQVDRTRTYPIAEAVALVKSTSTTKFDSAIELHAKVKGESIRGTITLPHGNGKTRKVVIATDEVLEDIAAGKLDFDVLVAAPAQMPKLAKFAKVLGPKGLMPSPKAGTVSDNPEAIVAEISGGRVEYRADKGGVVHMSIGKASFTDEQLVENYKVVEALMQAAKVQSISLASTMGPGVRVSLS